MNQAISAGHEETLAAAKIILENGGNAFDAAIAAGFAMFITETCMSSAGAGGFALCYTPGEEIEMLDFFTQTPRKKSSLENRDFYPIEVNFGMESETFHVGTASAAVPGIIHGLYALHHRKATMPMHELLQPAMQLAKKGATIDEFQHIDIGLLEVILRIDPSVRDIFFKNDKRLAIGDTMQMPHLGNFLDFLNDEGARGFYEGEISAIVAKDFREKGGYLQRADFTNYKSFWRKPLKNTFLAHNVYVPNGPSLGGALLLLALQDFEKHKNWISAISQTRGSYQTINEIKEGMQSMLPSVNFDISPGSTSKNGTSHFNILDKHNNAVSFTVSIGEGCGYFIPGTDMQMNNMLGESFLLPEGFHSWLPDTRLHSMMTPTMVTDLAGNIKLSAGSGGAGRIPYMISQVISALYENNLNLQEATELGRVYVQENVLHAEKNAIFDFKQNNFTKKEWDYQSLFFGGVHSISKNKNQLEAAGDPRRYGVSEVF